ncbi:NAD(P)/FAD-dependent oxidoreductase [Hyalangium versicolor]|uniref:NAD(P)/FAD-dependent oxidoreductase n=1 Tax=Hyalangium versicolor TaxID=2861190 RepID=UPI001CCC1B23|nr:NAD(P)/FAD-dependent oxidoreductase [Hyalangium versicolor]
MRTIDVAIVGGGPAGLAVAIHAARRGLSTVVFDRQALPADKACGEGLAPPGLRELEALGARQYLTPADCAPIVGVRYIQEDGTNVSGRFNPTPGLGIRRTALAAALTRTAQEAGVTLQDRCGVANVLRTPERVLLTTATGEEVEARLLVAADGLASPLRHAQGLEEPVKAHEPRRFGLRQHFHLPPWSEFVEIHLARGLEAYVTPAGSDRVGVAFLWEDGNVEGPISFPNLLHRFPALRERLEGAAPDSSARGAGPFLRKVRTRILDRFVLVGDAAGYVDAITGEGLTLALRGASTLGQLLPDILARGASRASLLPYERAIARHYWRYALSVRLMLMIARYPALRVRVLHALARHPALFESLVNFVAG